MAARTKRIVHDENTRMKIKASQLIKRLEKHILAEPEKDADGDMVIKGLMAQSQVTAALGLLKKVLPDLSAVELSGEVIHTDANELSDEELANIATTSRSGTTKPKNSKKEFH